MRACEWCGTMFTPTEPDHTYCKHVHAQKARKARNRAKQELAVVGRCPTPYKRVYVNAQHAEARHLPANQYLYPCACGAIHSATNRRTA